MRMRAGSGPFRNGQGDSAESPSAPSVSIWEWAFHSQTLSPSSAGMLARRPLPNASIQRYSCCVISRMTQAHAPANQPIQIAAPFAMRRLRPSAQPASITASAMGR